MFAYDWDTVLLADNATAFALSPLYLCTAYFPCELQVRGDARGSVELSGDAQLACKAGCAGISIHAVAFACRNNSASVFQVQGSRLSISQASFAGCRSDTDGGVVQAYGLAEVVIESCNFTGVHSGGFGGALAAYSSSLSVFDSQLHNCSSREGGGAIWAAAFQDCYGSNITNNTYLSISASVFSQCSTGSAQCAFEQEAQRR